MYGRNEVRVEPCRSQSSTTVEVAGAGFDIYPRSKGRMHTIKAIRTRNIDRSIDVRQAAAVMRSISSGNDSGTRRSVTTYKPCPKVPPTLSRPPSCPKFSRPRPRNALVIWLNWDRTQKAKGMATSPIALSPIRKVPMTLRVGNGMRGTCATARDIAASNQRPKGWSAVVAKPGRRALN
jgi:hypothetical protein